MFKTRSCLVRFGIIAQSGWPGRRARLLALALLSGCLLVTPASAIRTIYDGAAPEVILAITDMAFLGTVVDATPRLASPDHDMIATDFVIRLERLVYDPRQLLGTVSRGRTVTLTFFGGVLDDREIRIPGVPIPEVGQECIFLVQEENLGRASPLAGGNRGLYFVERGTVDATVVDAWGVPVRSRFFSDGQVGAVLRLDEFLADLAAALPRANADGSLVAPLHAPVAAPLQDEVFSGDQIPRATPANSGATTNSNDSAPLSGGPGVERGEDSPPPGDEGLTRPHAFSPPRDDQLGMWPLPMKEGSAFLWEPPNLPSIYNIPPMYYEGAQWGLNFEYSLSDWNRYASDVFRKYAVSDNTFGHQGRNDFAFTNDTDFESTYGFTPSSGWLGIAVMYNSSGDPISPGQQIFESDVILNVDQNWTLDFQTAYQNTNIWYFRSTTVHEAGHTVGREHQFTENLSAQWHSVMNYAPAGALDTEFYTTFMDDAASIRAAYPDNAVTIDDYGVYLFRTNGDGISSPVPVVWSTFPSTVVLGQSFTVSNFTIENLGTTSVNPVIDWYLSELNNSYAGDDYFIGTTTHGSLAPSTGLSSSRTFTVQGSIPIGSYYVSAYASSDDYNGNRAAWTFSRINVVEEPPPAWGEASVVGVESASPSKGWNCLMGLLIPIGAMLFWKGQRQRK
jgi:hypothetical protein